MNLLLFQLIVASLISFFVPMALKKLDFLLSAKDPKPSLSSSSSSSSYSYSVAPPFQIPTEFSAALSQYPNPLNIDISQARQSTCTDVKSQFYPVVHMEEYTVLDLSQTAGQSQIINREDQEAFMEERRSRKDMDVDVDMVTRTGTYTIGKYDENRANLYSSELFQNDDNMIDGYDGARTLHVGVDLGAPVGTEVHTFLDGVVHSVGYNEELGDYGHVVVVEYDLKSLYDNSHTNANTNTNTNSCDTSNDADTSCSCAHHKVWALYGHLDASTLKRNEVGKIVKRGEVLGCIGDVHENGGWNIPHVHFQLSIQEPATHDMPGAVALCDRERALVTYPDPRFVLGELY